MNPNAFLRSLWRMEWDPIVFVAMSFDEAYTKRFTDVFSPAISTLSANERQLSATRVDLSAFGDSIITEINNGIAHAQLVLADVSVTGRDAVSGVPFRNANVLYEVGIALASRRPEDVLLIRDDHEKFLFDVSAIPHATINFTDTDSACEQVSSLLQQRLNEQSFQEDSRVERACNRLSIEEIYILTPLAEKKDHVFTVKTDSVLRKTYGLQRLLDLDLLRYVGSTPAGDPQYGLTPIGCVVADRVHIQK